MNKSVIFAFLVTASASCQDQELFDNVFRKIDLGKSTIPPPDGPSGHSDMASFPLLWEESFPNSRTGSNGRNNGKSSVAYWSFDNSHDTLPQWSLAAFVSNSALDANMWNILDFQTMPSPPPPPPPPPPPIIDSPIGAYAIFHPPASHNAQVLSLCISYYLTKVPGFMISSVPVDLSVSLLGPGLSVLSFPNSNDKKFVGTQDMIMTKEFHFDFGAQSPLPIHGLQLEYTGEIAGTSMISVPNQHIRIISLSLYAAPKCP